MARKRLSDTEALTRRPATFPVNQTTEVRAIENGHIVRHSGVNADGEYFSREYHTPKMPQMGDGGRLTLTGGRPQPNPLTEAKKAL